MLNFSHFQRMTDEIGIMQFSQEDLPDKRSGYTLDDNARGLIVAVLSGEEAYLYASRFINYMAQSQRPDGSWSNFFLDGKYSSRFNSEDSIGRALMACSAASRSIWPDLSAQAGQMLKNNLPCVRSFTSPRAIAYTLVGLCTGDIPCSDTQLNDLISKLSTYLISRYERTRSKDWMWFEDYLTYCNGILPQALFSVYAFTGNKKCLKIAHESLSFLTSILFSKGYLNIIGNYGWYNKEGSLALFDQQPVDAASIAFACWEAYENLGKREYLELAELAHQWYRGKNIHSLSLYNDKTGGCYDSLTQDGVNLNQGAEAVLSLLLTDLLMDRRISQAHNKIKSS